ncbi:MAG: acyl-CoA/acyl-ACP dehydrogenase [Nevskiales bacterium]|nr:acyl-CoA/acyl-ACP dehydrogenase [Nevskiales bacterium]
MNFALTEDQVLIRDAAESFLADVSTSEAVRAAAGHPYGYDVEVWQRLSAELGWCSIAVPEALGGMGLGAPELVLIQEQAGRHLLCAPFFSTVCLAANLIDACATAAARERLLPAIAGGELRVTVGLGSSAEDWTDVAAAVRAHRTADGWVLDGCIERVPDGVSADRLLVWAQVDGESEPALFVVNLDAPGIEVAALQTWDATRHLSRIALRGVSAVVGADASMRIDDPQRVATGRVRSAALARLYLAAELLGHAQQCLDLTVAYTAERKQFGRPVGGFQAVKHRCAEMMVRIESLRSGVYGASARAASGADGAQGSAELARECAMIKALAAQTAFYCAQEAIQLHGGVGFTWEYDPQLYFKRAQAAHHWLGTPEMLRARVADALLN